MNLKHARHLGATCGWMVFGLKSSSGLSILQDDHIGNLDASPFLPSGCASNIQLWATRDVERDFPIQEPKGRTGD